MEPNARHAIIAFDVDGTVTESKTDISGEMTGLLCELLEQKKVALISGAPLSRFQEQILKFLQCVAADRQEAMNLYLLPVNGSQCYEFNPASKAWELVDETPLPEPIKARALQAIDEMVADPALGVPPQPRGAYVEDRGTQLTFAALGHDAPLPEKAAWDTDHAKRERLKVYLDARIGDVAEVTIAGTTSLDIVEKGFTKATGLIRLLHRLRLGTKDMLFVGDSIFPGGNDYAPKEAGIDAIPVTGPAQTAEVIRALR